MTIATSEPLIIIDGHVHIHDCFFLPKFLDAGHRNCRTEAQRRGQGDAFTGVLLLTESYGIDWFERFRSYADHHETLGSASTSLWQFHYTDESCSLLAESTRGSKLFVIAGRQIVTKEKLEVLALMTDHAFPDGTFLEDTIKAVRLSDGIPVIPWGFGKWWGQRGKILSDLIPSQPAADFFLGDNSSRPAFLPYPTQFTQAEKLGIRILPGSDPLPFSSEYWRLCSVGFSLKGVLQERTPSTGLKVLLRDPTTVVSPYIQPENWHRFLKNQLAMQIVKRRSTNSC